MLRPQSFVIASLALIAGFFFVQHFRIAGLDRLKIENRDMPQELRTKIRPADSAPVVHRPGETIRIASFSIQTLGEAKMNTPGVIDMLVRVIRNFDIIAIQDIQCQHDDLLAALVEFVNAKGSHYEYAIGPRLPEAPGREQLALIFDRESVELNRAQMYTMQDPENWIRREPLVAQFRVRGPAHEEAFTFTLVNVHVEPQAVIREINILDNVYKAVRDDGLEEDDVILLGNFGVDDRHFGELAEISGMVCVISGQPTNTAMTAQLDNLVFNERTTTEYTGRHGVFDFRREFNLSNDQALTVSDHLPVWAEFSIYEQNALGRLASERSDSSFGRRTSR